MDAAKKNVTVDELQPGMVISDITELSFDYTNLDAKTVEFLKTNFKGAHALVITDSGEESVEVEKLAEFDQLQALVDIPPSLKVVQVVPGLAESLKKRGFMEFKVSFDAGSAATGETAAEEVAAPAIKTEQKSPRLAVGSDEAKKRSAVKMEEVREFVEKVAEAEDNREKSSSTVEEMFDKGRTGKFDSKGAAAAVTSIVEKGTASGMRAVAGLKGSDQTYTHCVDMSVILQGCYQDIQERSGKELDDKATQFALLAGFMHDIGKSEIPKDILESTERFPPDSKEMMMMRNHTVYGAKILTDMGMAKAAINVAHYHHVKKDRTMFTCYPDVPYDQVNPITRLASVVDVYQALIGKRKYKKNWVPGAAVEFIMGLSGTEFDERIVNHFLKSMGKYPIGSLVRLTTGDLAFVLALAPFDVPERPIVAIVENASGEMLGSATIMDLMLDQDIQVTEVIDHYEHYADSEDQAYQIFQSISIS